LAPGTLATAHNKKDHAVQNQSDGGGSVSVIVHPIPSIWPVSLGVDRLGSVELFLLHCGMMDMNGSMMHYVLGIGLVVVATHE